MRMKNISLLTNIIGGIMSIIGMISMLSSCNNICKENIKIEGTIENQGYEPLVLLYQDAIGNRVIQDTTIPVIKNKFEYEGPLKYGEGIYLLTNQQNNMQPLVLFLSGGELFKISGKATSLSAAEVKGGKGHTLFQKYLIEYKPKFVAKRASINKIFQQQMADEDTLAMLTIDSLNNALTALELNEQEKFLLANKSNPFSLQLLIEAFIVGNTDYAKATKLFSELDENIQNSERGKKINSFLGSLKNLTVGYPLQEFMLPNEKNELDSFSANYRNNKLTLIDFWASWCKPCRIKHPTLVKLYNTYHNAGFEIVSFSLDTDIEEWQKAKEQDGLKWKQYCDKRSWNSGVCKILNIRAIPFSYLVDSNGIIIAKNPSIYEIERILLQKLTTQK